MKKILTSLVVAGALSGAFAHDFWVVGKNMDKFSADIGYGHSFPKPEAIAEKRLSLFAPLYIVDKSGAKIVLKQAGENYHYEGEKLQKGTYVLAGDYKPTFWTKDKDGKWHMDGTRENVKNVESCGYIGRTAKDIVVEGGEIDEFVYKPIGQIAEIVPLSDVTKIKAGEPFKVQFFANGKPAKVAKVTGAIEGFPEGKYTFLGTTDLKGMIEVIAIKEGKWLLEATYKAPYADANKCDEETLSATLVIDVKK
ncbi:DUF4198 domain-containing protein [Campylobacter sp. MOP51]|uniref:DUF4198 domain-containing protein n=1 Tax=Campylobacter canis TaxID=3378588 RepID=UPI003C59423E